MKATGLRLTALFYLLTGTALGAAAFVQSPINSPFSISVPAVAFELDDLDLRDALNRPIKSSAVRRATERLFFKGLHDLLLNNITPARRSVLLRLAQTWPTHRIWFSELLSRWNPVVEFIARAARMVRPDADSKRVTFGAAAAQGRPLCLPLSLSFESFTSLLLSCVTLIR